MQQVLFFIPIKGIAQSLPPLEWWVYLALAALAVGVGGWLGKRASAEGKKGVWFQGGGIVLGVLLALAAAVVKFQDTEWAPIYGYGTMLFVAFLACTWLASRLAAAEGIDPLRVQDMAIWIFIAGIIGARLVFMFIAEPDKFDWRFPTIVGQFLRVWDGGLVFYGSAIGGLIGYYLCYRFVLRKHNVSSWKMADIIAPCAALGLALGRLGCLLNGCCYGNVAVCADCPGISFPLSSPPRFDMVGRGYQTAAGFTLHSGADPTQPPTVDRVEPGLPVDLRPGDRIEAINGKEIGSIDPITQERQTVNSLFRNRPRGQNTLSLKVKRGQSEFELAYAHRTVLLHPTQIYESISMLLVFLLLLAYYPLRSQPGAVMVLFMFCYGIHRYLNEMLRTDTEPVAFGLTLSQTVSIVVIGVATVLAALLRIKSLKASAAPPAPPAPPAAAPLSSASSE